jgi:cell division protein FtsA
VLKELIAQGRGRGYPVVVDPKGADYSLYAGATVITPNRKEAELAVGYSLARREDLVRAGYDNQITSGVVVTGGSAELAGVAELAEQVFNAPARVGYPQKVSGLVEIVNKPMYATAVGLVLYGAKRSRGDKKFRIRDSNIFSKVTERMKKWFKEVM